MDEPVNVWQQLFLSQTSSPHSDDSAWGTPILIPIQGRNWVRPFKDISTWYCSVTTTRDLGFYPSDMRSRWSVSQMNSVHYKYKSCSVCCKDIRPYLADVERIGANMRRRQATDKRTSWGLWPYGARVKVQTKLYSIVAQVKFNIEKSMRKCAKTKFNEFSNVCKFSKHFVDLKD